MGSVLGQPYHVRQVRPMDLYRGLMRNECFSLLLPSSDPKTKQPNGSKHKLTKAASLPGKNGNPTFAAVTAGYDKSPGEWLGV